MIQTHAGHVINAIDPTIVAQGPGLGYGVKKAAQGVCDSMPTSPQWPPTRTRW